MNKKLEKRDNVIIVLSVALAVAVLCCGVLGIVLGIGGVPDTTMGVAQAYTNGGISGGRNYEVREFDLSGYFDDSETTIYYVGSNYETQFFTILSWNDLSYAIRDVYYPNSETWNIEQFQLSHIPVQIFADLILTYTGGTYYQGEVEIEVAIDNVFNSTLHQDYQYHYYDPSTPVRPLNFDEYRVFGNSLILNMLSNENINMNFNVQVMNVKVACFDYSGEYDVIYDLGSDSSEESSYQAGYDYGYEVGEDAGFDLGEDYGYTNGYADGKIEGRNQGYADGVAAAGDYTFFSLITSVFDAPLKVLVGEWVDVDDDGIVDEMRGGMLNFYIPVLDVNLAPLLLSLFTLCIIIIVVRFVLARL